MWDLGPPVSDKCIVHLLFEERPDGVADTGTPFRESR